MPIEAVKRQPLQMPRNIAWVKNICQNVVAKDARIIEPTIPKIITACVEMR
jgi:hypothetical protein